MNYVRYGVAIFSLALAVSSMALAANAKDDEVLKEVQNDPKLPRVMLIGDSISMGYTLQVRDLLKGKANVHRPAANCGDTARGLQFLSRWLGDGKWDVIHFNFGLHDLKYLDAKGKYVSPDKGKQVASTEVYEKNLRAIVAELKKTNAKLIFATTTPVPDASLGRVKGDEVKYNEVAVKVMTEEGVAVDDLHAVIDAHPDLVQKGNVHYKADGYKLLAEQVVKTIDAALGK